MCSLLLGLTGNMEFTVLEYCTKWSATNKDNKVIENNLNIADCHNTSTDSSSSLSDQLSSVSNPEKISELIKLHAKQMSMPPHPPRITHQFKPTPIIPKKPKKSFVFVLHGIR